MLTGRLIAAALAAFAAVAVGAIPAPTATAASTKCIALEVDFTTTGGPVSTACVTVPSNASGSDVLVAGHHKVTFDPRYGNDFVCAIDGVPASGCHGVDDTHFWAYYHRSPGSSSWQISQEGAGTYQPKNTATEGWIYDDGHTNAPHPRDVPYSTICPKQSPSPTASAPATSAPSRHVTSPAAVTTARSTAPAAHASATSASKSPTAASATTTASASAPDATSTSPAAAVTAHADPPAASKSSFPVGLVVGIGAAVALGGGAFVVSRRSHG